MEATGGYERLALATLTQAGFPSVAVNPRQAREFARAMGKLEKTDEVDARMLMLFAERVRPTARPLVDETTRMFDELIARRRQIVEMLTAEKNRQKQAQRGRARRAGREEARLEREGRAPRGPSGRRARDRTNAAECCSRARYAEP